MEASIETVNKFREMVRRLENNDFAERAADSCRFIHSTLGLVTETAELSSVISNRINYRAMDYDLKVMGEVGDIIFYLLQGQDCFPEVVHSDDYVCRYIKVRLGSSYDPITKLQMCVGEVADILKKHLVCNRPVDSNKICNWYENIWIYLVELLDELGFCIPECLVVTSAKLNYRYPKETFCYEDRANRNRDGEREVMLAALKEYELTFGD